MIELRLSSERGHFNYDWLDTKHTFSFGEYQDPAYLNFRSLRVINEDIIAPGKGFGMHPHHDMEIITFMIDGKLKHADSKGYQGEISRGQIQVMSAGSGITHSEHNALPDTPCKLLQIWIEPAVKSISPSYNQFEFKDLWSKEGLTLLVSGYQKKEGIAFIHQKAEMYFGFISFPNNFTNPLDLKKGAWVQVIEGALELNGEILKEGDGARIEDEEDLSVWAVSDEVRFLLFVMD